MVPMTLLGLWPEVLNPNCICLPDSRMEDCFGFFFPQRIILTLNKPHRKEVSFGGCELHPNHSLIHLLLCTAPKTSTSQHFCHQQSRQAVNLWGQVPGQPAHCVIVHGTESYHDLCS